MEANAHLRLQAAALWAAGIARRVKKKEIKNPWILAMWRKYSPSTHLSALMTIKLYTDICVGPYTSSLTVDTGAPTKERGKKGLALQEGGPISPCLLQGNNLIQVPGVISLHAGSGTWWRRRAIGTGSLQIMWVQDVSGPSPDSLHNLDAMSHRYRCRTPITSFTSLALDALVKAKAESKCCKHPNPLLSENLSLKCLISSKVHFQVATVVPLCHDPIVKASDVLVTCVSRSQFYELGKCVSYSSPFKHFSRWSPWKTAFHCSCLLGLIWRIFQGIVSLLGGILLGHIISRQVPSSVPGLKTTGSSTEWEGAKQGSHTSLSSGKIK